MKKVFGISHKDLFAVVIEAESKEEMMKIFAKEIVNSNGGVLGIFIDYIKDFEIAEDLAYKFPNETAPFPAEFEGYKYKDYLFNNTRFDAYYFWNDKPEYAELFMKEYYELLRASAEGYDVVNYNSPKFPDDFLVDTLIRMIEHDIYFDDVEIKELNFEKSKFKLLFEN